MQPFQGSQRRAWFRGDLLKSATLILISQPDEMTAFQSTNVSDTEPLGSVSLTSVDVCGDYTVCDINNKPKKRKHTI